MNGQGPLDDLERRAIASWDAMEPPVGFVERVMSEASGKPRKKLTPDQPSMPYGPDDELEDLFIPWKRPWLGLAVASLVIGLAVAFHFVSQPQQLEVKPPPKPGVSMTTPAKTDKVSPLDEHRIKAKDRRPNPVPKGLHQDVEAYISSYGRNYGEDFKFHGTVIVDRAGATEFDRSYGVAQRGSPAVTHNHNKMMRLGSLTQQITAVAVMQLVQKGKIGLSDSVRAHLPDYPVNGDFISIEQLLSHRSGLPNFTDDPEWKERRVHKLDTDALITQFKDKSLEFTPGTDFEPTNSGYALLGAIIERVSGMTYEQYVQTHIFEPAGMDLSRLGENYLDIRMAHGYSRDDDDAPVPAERFELASYGAAGGLVSTPVDMVRFNRALNDGTLLDAKWRDLMYTPVVDNKYAFGWVVEHRHGKTVVSHPGGIDGFNASLMYFVEDDTTVMCMSNSDVVDCRDIADAVSAMVYGKEVDPPVEHVAVDFDQSKVSEYVGHCTLSDKSREHYARVIDPDMLNQLKSVEFYGRDAARGGGLSMFIPLHGNRRMYAMGPDKFFFKDYQGTTATFHRDVDSGEITWVTLEQGEFEFILLPGEAEAPLEATHKTMEVRSGEFRPTPE